MKAQRTPVWLVTGFLGSGKTTLLTAWLREPALARAALIVNEIGEVGLDDRLLAQAVDSAGLLANSCLCCSGMQGLQEALETLWWDRLHRRRPAFDAVVIETTGLADPAPVLEAFHAVEMLRERYLLAGVVATVSATAGVDVLATHAEARSQVRHADALVITKTDRTGDAPVAAALRALNAHAPILRSAQASLGWSEVAGTMPAGAPPPHDAGGHHAHAHHHGTSARFLPLASPLSRSALEAQVATLRRGPLLRLKGVVELAGSGLHTLQWAPGDDTPSLLPYEGPQAPLGLTCIQAA